MSAKDGCEVQGDVARNRIVMSFRGAVGVTETKAAADAVMLLLPQMRRGFTVVTDLSGLDSMDLDCATEIAKLMEALRANGIGTVVRIIPDPTKDIGLNILSIVHYRRRVQVITFQNAGEAGRMLNSLS